ncbi:MAG: hypothetical protein H0U60_13275 [Blastocatellia bacterium]|nr:hypothetical protein [Blastocatellia bacterium]
MATARLAMTLLSEAQSKKVLAVNDALNIIDAAVAALALANTFTNRNDFTKVPDATANYGVINVGSAGFAGGGGTNYAGSATGTLIAMNAATGFTGDFINCQLGAGVNKAQLTKDGRLVLADLVSAALFQAGYLAKTTTFTLGATAALHNCDATAGAFNMQLPNAAGRVGRIYTIKKVDSSANAVTVTTTSSETIDAATTYVLATQWKSVSVYSNGASWSIMSSV